ncbi:MAG: CDP-alcohol phosphatidyltransferase family protein [Cyclobacteriaceae bacterium]
MDSSFNSFSRKWSQVNAVINVVGLSLAWYFDIEWFWWAAIFVWFTYYIMNIPKLHAGLPLGVGYANLITICRFILLLSLLIAHDYLLPEILFSGFLIVVILDGVDGWAARRYGQSSTVGELLDMETDAFMVLSLSWIHFQSDLVGWWILIPGGMRYYVELLLSRFLSNYREPLPKKLRSTIAVLFFGCLIGAFVLPEYWAILALKISSVLILTSFGMSILLRIIFRRKSV